MNSPTTHNGSEHLRTSQNLESRFSFIPHNVGFHVRLTLPHNVGLSVRLTLPHNVGLSVRLTHPGTAWNGLEISQIVSERQRTYQKVLDHHRTSRKH